MRSRLLNIMDVRVCRYYIIAEYYLMIISGMESPKYLHTRRQQEIIQFKVLNEIPLIDRSGYNTEIMITPAE